MTGRLLILLGYAAIGSFLAVPHAAHAERSWEQKLFSYISVNQDIASVLKEFSYINDIPLITSEKVQGRVQGRWLDIPCGEFLQKMSRLYDFDWYDDGSTLYISSKSERTTQIIPLHNHTLSELKTGLQNLGLLDRRFDITPGPASDTLAVSGPPRFLSMIQQTLLSLPNTAHPARAMSNSSRHLTLFRGSAVSDVIVN